VALELLTTVVRIGTFAFFLLFLLFVFVPIVVIVIVVAVCPIPDGAMTGHARLREK
jgi:hypothetical protein